MKRLLESPIGTVPCRAGVWALGSQSRSDTKLWLRGSCQCALLITEPTPNTDRLSSGKERLPELQGPWKRLRKWHQMFCPPSGTKRLNLPLSKWPAGLKSGSYHPGPCRGPDSEPMAQRMPTNLFPSFLKKKKKKEQLGHYLGGRKDMKMSEGWGGRKGGKEREREGERGGLLDE